MAVKRKPGPDPLGTYRAKRSLDRTPEPGAAAPVATPSAGGLFVVHMHAARRLHWDLRLEMDGVLKSWAVPKGPSPNRADKRLAVLVEDHPLEYGDFEGIIPEGNYGAGAVIVWDRGRWVPLEDPQEGLKKGKLLFELRGYKLHGKWTLVKLKKGEKEWLLIKEKDGYVADDGALPPQSVLSGLTVEELKAGANRAAPALELLARLKAPRRAVRPEEAEPMLAETRERPFTKPGWLFELKLDGYRVRAARHGGEAQLITRNGHDIAETFPEIARALAALPYDDVILDGELVVPDDAGRPSFQRLQNRARVSRALDVRRAAVETPALLYAFDLLAFAGYDLRPPPPALAGPAPQDPGHSWVEPTLVAEVRYKEWTDEGLLRQPVFMRFRDDKPVTEVAILGAGGGERDLELPAESTAPRAPLPKEVKFSNLDKVFWPDDGYTKGDLIDYYRAISPWLLPYLKDRPVVMTRYPDGITGKSFFQKDAPAFAPDWLRTERMWSEDTQREIDYFVCDDLESLLYLANLGTIPLHVWGSRTTSLEQPDWCILDLDPKEAPFTHVVTVAKAVKRLCDEIELPCFIKTSGSTGLHVLLPLGRQCTYEQCRQLGGLLARVIATQLPEIATVTRQVGKRGARVYLDYVQNGHGRLLVAPFSVRPLPGAPVSTPLLWREVGPNLDIRRFTIRSVPARMQKLRDDPLLPVLDARPDLVAALARLHPPP